MAAADIENVLVLLCKQINLCTGIDFSTDHLQLAKHNRENEYLAQSFWSVLNVLSHCAINKINPQLNFQHYGEIKATKLYFAYLGYGAIEFYILSDKFYDSRVLLIALGWLIASHNCFNTIVHEKLIESMLGREFINSNDCNIDDEELIENNISLTMSSQIHLLIHKCNRINNNLKEIAELIAEKIRLTVKIHCASLNTHNLPHLNTTELYLIKQLYTQTKNDETILQECENGFEQLHKIGVLLEIYTKWTKSEAIFYNWMETILEDTKNNPINLPIKNNDELSTIICIIRHLTKKKIHTIKLSDVDTAAEKINNNLSNQPCVSRFQRINNHSTNNTTNSNETKLLQQLNKLNQNIEKKMSKFNTELKLIVKSIPNCLQV